MVSGVLEKECNEINRVFRHYITTKRPYVVMKTAMTLDGKIATATGESQWISGEASRKDVHRLRHNYTGIMVGINTIIPVSYTHLDKHEGELIRCAIEFNDLDVEDILMPRVDVIAVEENDLSLIHI